MNFKNFYFSEKEMYVSLDDTPHGKSLGTIDTDDQHYDKKVNRIISQLNIEKINECLKILMEGKNIQKYENEFRSLFMKYTMNHSKLEILAKTIRGKESFDYLKNFTIKQMYEFYNKKAPNVLNSKFYTSLYNLVPGFGGAGKQIGKGELLLALMTNLDKSTGKGDLMDTNGENIEVKTDRAKFKGGDSSKLINGPTTIKKISKIIGEEIKDASVNTSVLAKVFEYIQTHRKDTEELLKVLLNYSNVNLPKEAIKIFNSIKESKEFLSLALALQAYAYISDEGIKRIFFLKGNTIEDIIVIIFEYTNFESLFHFVNKNLRNVGDWTMKAGFSFAFT